MSLGVEKQTKMLTTTRNIYYTETSRSYCYIFICGSKYMYGGSVNPLGN